MTLGAVQKLSHAILGPCRHTHSHTHTHTPTHTHTYTISHHSHVFLGSPPHFLMCENQRHMKNLFANLSLKFNLLCVTKIFSLYELPPPPSHAFLTLMAGPPPFPPSWGMSSYLYSPLQGCVCTATQQFNWYLAGIESI